MLKSAFSGYNAVADVYGSIFIRLAVFVAKSRQILSKFELIHQGHPSSSILVLVESI